ncbi:MAG: tail fiber domain-containing protein, partial [Candidatus Woesearchaeota archaeon]
KPCLFTNSAAATLLEVVSDGQINTGAAAASPYNNTTASAANMFVTSAGLLQRSTSSLRFKTDIEDMLPEYAEAVIYKSRPVFYRSTCESDNPMHSYWGLIAEELALIDPRFVFWGKPLHTVIKDVEKEVVRRDADGAKVTAEDGSFVYDKVVEQVEVTETDEAAEPIPDGVMYDRLVVALILDAQQKKMAMADQQVQLDSLLARVMALEAKSSI